MPLPPGITPPVCWRHAPLPLVCQAFAAASQICFVYFSFTIGYDCELTMIRHLLR
jgi:hypothetical protein